MRYSTQVKPISYLKANAAGILEEMQETRAPMLITQNGEAKAVLVDIATFEEQQETLAMLKILSLSELQIANGQFKTLEQVTRDFRAKFAVPAVKAA
jgi:prevent-host-death family protein